jgi:hypothetical protein
LPHRPRANLHRGVERASMTVATFACSSVRSLQKHRRIERGARSSTEANEQALP